MTATQDFFNKIETALEDAQLDVYMNFDPDDDDRIDTDPLFAINVHFVGAFGQPNRLAWHRLWRFDVWAGSPDIIKEPDYADAD